MLDSHEAVLSLALLQGVLDQRAQLLKEELLRGFGRAARTLHLTVLFTQGFSAGINWDTDSAQTSPRNKTLRAQNKKKKQYSIVLQRDIQLFFFFYRHSNKLFFEVLQKQLQYLNFSYFPNFWVKNFFSRHKELIKMNFLMEINKKNFQLFLY